ncbi:hypothetical protein [Janthinobacterium sp. B9-8]|nr:hypothetical protein [Janthinobacterium sp. B9-8]
MLATAGCLHRIDQTRQEPDKHGSTGPHQLKQADQTMLETSR